MEKEASFALNPRTTVKLLHPALQSKVRYLQNTTRCVKALLASRIPLKCVSNIISMVGLDQPDKCVLEVTPISEIECTCKGEQCDALMKILPTGVNTEQVICYNSCARTLYAAFKRQLKRVPEPESSALTEFQQFCEDYFVKYVEPYLREFDYSYSQWFNAMPRHKQEAILAADPDYRGEKVTFGLFCKREKQAFGGKNRAIANISQEVKNIMGPVCWALEDLADKHFPGYCGKKSWEKLEKFLEESYSLGFVHSLQGDGSGFDLSQHVGCKYIDYRIYNYLVDNHKIHHVDPEIFRRVTTATTRYIEAKYQKDKGLHPFAKASIEGTVFSGSSDTTLMNTLRMALYNMFTLKKMGLEIDRDYRILAKGDDFMVLTRRLDIDFERNYYKYWCTKDQGEKTGFQPYGIGQILKFLLIGDFSTIDFCSTTVIPFEGGSRFKIARKPERMLPLAHYSRAALSMSSGELKQYYLDQATSIDMCMPNMPFYREYAQAYRHYASRITVPAVRKKGGRVRLHLDDDGHAKIVSDKERLLDMYGAYGSEYIYTMETRVSTTQIPEEDVYMHFLAKYGITQADIAIHKDFLLGGGLYDHMSHMLANPPAQ